MCLPVADQLPVDVDGQEDSRTGSNRRRVFCGGAALEWRRGRVNTPETAALIGGTTATITAAARPIYPYDAWLDDVYARAKEQLDKVAREHFPIPGTIADAVVVVARGQRRDLR
jgi:hypothetical protein